MHFAQINAPIDLPRTIKVDEVFGSVSRLQIQNKYICVTWGLRTSIVLLFNTKGYIFLTSLSALCYRLIKKVVCLKMLFY